MSVNVTAHVVQPICPRCGRVVRNNLEIRDALLDVAALMAEAQRRFASGRAGDVGLYCDTATIAAGFLDDLRAELCGLHLHCAEPGRRPVLAAVDRLS